MTHQSLTLLSENIDTNVSDLMNDISSVEQTANTALAKQPDWNQDDATANDFIKNRPFGDLPETEETVVASDELSFSQQSYADLTLYASTLPAPFAMTIGKTYYIYIDGQKYEFVASALGTSVIGGNSSILGYGDDTGEPFIVTPSAVAIEADSSPSAVSIATMITPVKMIDQKYIPFDERAVRRYYIDDTIIAFDELKEIAEEMLTKGGILQWGDGIFVAPQFPDENRIQFVNIVGDSVCEIEHTKGTRGEVVRHGYTSKLLGLDVTTRILRLADPDSGGTNDLTAHYNNTYSESNDHVRCVGAIVFDEPLCGAYRLKKMQSTEFRSVYEADTNMVYQQCFAYILDSSPTGAFTRKDLLREDEYLILRTRVRQDVRGRIVSSHYSKIDGPFFVGSMMRFECSFFNPVPNDPNLEYSGTNLAPYRR